MKGLGGALVNMTDLTTSTARGQTGRRQTVGARSKLSSRNVKQGQLL